MSGILTTAEQVLSACSNMLEVAKRDHDRTTLMDGEHARSMLQEAQGYLMSARDVLEGRPFGAHASDVSSASGRPSSEAGSPSSLPSSSDGSSST